MDDTAARNPTVRTIRAVRVGNAAECLDGVAELAQNNEFFEANQLLLHVHNLLVTMVKEHPDLLPTIVIAHHALIGMWYQRATSNNPEYRLATVSSIKLMLLRNNNHINSTDLCFYESLATAID